MSTVLIVGPPGSGKGLLHNILAASPHLTAGTFSMQSYPCSRPRSADRYIVAARAAAAESIAPHRWRTHTLAMAEEYVGVGRRQLVEHIGSAPTLTVNYRDVVADVADVIASQLAPFLRVPPWEYLGDIFDGDTAYG